MIYKNLYMKDTDYNIRDDKMYLTRVIRDQKWEKFLDVYTLNRMIRMLIENDDQDADLSEMINAFLKRIWFRFNRVMFSWSIMSLSGSLLGGILSFLLFVQHANKPLRYILNVLIFSGVAMVTTEKILVLFLCELCFPIMDSKLIFDVTRDTFNSLRKGVLNIYENTRAESIFFSLLLSTLSFFNLSWISIMIVVGVNLLLFFRFRYSDLNMGKVRMIEEKPKDPPQNVDSLLEITRDMTLGGIKNYLSMISEHLVFSDSENDKDNVAEPVCLPNAESDEFNYSINRNSDVIRYITHAVRSNLLYKTLISQSIIDKFDLYRMFVYYFSLLVFGYISGFAGLHIILLPIVIQNVVDIIW
jgi:hypothetical protein